MRTSTPNVTYGDITVFLNLHNVYVIRKLPESQFTLIHNFLRIFHQNCWAETIFFRIIKTYLWTHRQTDGLTDRRMDELIWGGLGNLPDLDKTWDETLVTFQFRGYEIFFLMQKGPCILSSVRGGFGMILAGRHPLQSFPTSGLKET